MNEIRRFTRSTPTADATATLRLDGTHRRPHSWAAGLSSEAGDGEDAGLVNNAAVLSTWPTGFLGMEGEREREGKRKGKREREKKRKGERERGGGR